MPATKGIASRPQADEQARVDELIDAIEAVREENQRYSDSPSTVTAPQREFYETLIECIDAFAGARVPSELQPVAAKLESVALAFATFADRCAASFRNILEIDPGKDFWSECGALYREVDEFLSPPSLPPIESIEQLLLEKIDPRQIAAMLEMPLVDVIRERDKPGSVCGPGWEAPVLQRMREDRARNLLSRWSPSHLSVLANCDQRLKALVSDGLLQGGFTGVPRRAKSR